MKQAQHLGTCALIFNSQGNILLGKRKNSYKAGLYGLPGERLEVNEPVLSAITREIQEETGLTGLNLEYIGIVRENQGEYGFIHFVYSARILEQEPILCEPEKCEGWEWLDVNNLVQPILAGHQAAIELYIQRKDFSDLTDGD